MTGVLGAKVQGLRSLEELSHCGDLIVRILCYS
jgi:hypothetical protein